MKSLKSTSSMTLYEQLANTIRNDIYEGKFKQDERIPSELELSDMYSISRSTVRKAITLLVQEKLLVKIHGKGTFVASPKVVTNSHSFLSFTDNVKSMGHILVTKTIKISFQEPSHDDIEFFSLDESADEVLVIERLRFIDGIAIGIETVHFPKEYEFLKDENLDKSLYSILKDKYKIYPSMGSKTIEICYATLEESTLLDVPRGTALMLIEDKVFDSMNNPLHISKQVIRGDKFKYAIQ